MHKMIGVRFMLEGTSFIMAVMPDEEAKQIINGFINGSLKKVVGNVQGGWAIRVDDIQGIHTVPLEQMGQMGVPQNPLCYDSSGLPLR